MQTTLPRIALVTGGMGGIGTAICQKLAGEEHSVVANCLPAYPQKDAWLREQRGLGWDFIAAEGDVADYGSCRDMVATIENEVGAIDGMDSTVPTEVVLGGHRVELVKGKFTFTRQNLQTTLVGSVPKRTDPSAN